MIEAVWGFARTVAIGRARLLHAAALIGRARDDCVRGTRGRGPADPAIQLNLASRTRPRRCELSCQRRGR